MAVNVLGGPLDFEATVTTEQLESQLQSAFQKSSAEVNDFNNLLAKTGEHMAGAFDARSINKFSEAIGVARDKIGPLLEKGLAGFDDKNLLNKLKLDISQTTDEFQQLQKIVKFTEDNLQNFKLSPDEINQLGAAINVVKESFEGLTDKQKTALVQLRNLKEQLVSKGETDPGFKETFAEAAKLEQKMKDVNKQLKLASEHAPGIQAATQAFRGLIGGFEAVAGAAALFSGSNEQSEKTIKTLIASMGILQGLEEVMAVVEKDSALNVFLQAQYRKLSALAADEQAVATEAVAGAEVAEAAAAETATVATEGLNAAMLANPAGILLATLAAVVIAMQAFSSQEAEATKEQLEFNKAAAEANEILVKLVELQVQGRKDATREAQNAVTLAQAQGKSEREINELRIKALQAEKEENQVRLRTIIGDESLIGLKQAQLASILEQEEAIKRLGESGKELNQFDKDRLANLEAQEKGVRAILETSETAKEKIIQGNAEIEALRAGAGKKATEDALKSAQAEADARFLLAKKNTKEELDLRIAAIQARARLELHDPDLTKGERQRIHAQEIKDIEDAERNFRIVQLNNEKSLIQARLSAVKIGTAQELALKTDLINKSAEIELSQEGITQERVKEIESQARFERIELARQFNAENAKIEVETTIAGINQRLAKVQDGSEEELRLKKELIDAKADLDAINVGDQIKNAELVAARVKEIDAQALKEKKDADDQFTNRQLENQLKIIERTNDILNAPLQNTANNPFATLNQKFEAQREIFKNNLDAIKNELKLLDDDIKNNTGDINRLTEKRLELVAKQKKAEGDLANLENKHSIDAIKKIAADIGSVSNSLHGLSAALKESNPELSKFLDSLADVGNLVSTAASAFASFQSGDIAGGISSTVGFISGFINVLNKGREERKRQQQELDEFQQKIFTGEQEINLLYRERAREQAKINDLKLLGLAIEHQTLEEQRKANLQQFQDVLAQIQKLQGKQVTNIPGLFGVNLQSITALSLAGKSFEDLEKLFIKGQLEGKAKELFETLQKIKQEGVDIDALLKANTEEAKQIFTGTTAESITDSIVDGFKNGLRSASDFADTFQELMQNAMLQSLKFQTVEPLIKQFFEDFAASSESDNVLTEAEISALRDKWIEDLGIVGKKFDDLQKVTGLGLPGGAGAGKSLTGAIKGITEETAGLIAGQFGAFRLTALEHLQISKIHLTAIEINTAETVLRLDTMLSRMEFYYNVQGVKMR
jgi:hypothetical protein